MSEHKVKLSWTLKSGEFTYESYNRDHVLEYGTGSSIRASAGSEFKGDDHLTNPEEELVGALSSCHMLTFLAVAAKRGFYVQNYEDNAIGILEKNAEGKMAVTRVTLRPHVTFGGTKSPTPDDLLRLHDSAHRHCFIANSIKSDVSVEPV